VKVQKVLECIHKCNIAEEILVKGSDGESPLNVFTDLMTRLQKGIVLCAFGG